MVRAIALVLLLSLTSGCAQWPYVGVASTKVTYYNEAGRPILQVQHTTSWRQAVVFASLATHNGEYHMVLSDLGTFRGAGVLIEHKAMSGEKGLGGAWGAFVGFLSGLATRYLTGA